MSERAKPLLYGLALGAAVAATLLVVSFFFLAGSLAHAATLLNRVSMCVVSLAETRTLPLGLMLPLLLALGSVVSLAPVTMQAACERRRCTRGGHRCLPHPGLTASRVLLRPAPTAHRLHVGPARPPLQ